MKKYWISLLLFSWGLLICAAEFQIYKDGKALAVIEENAEGKRWINDFIRYAEACTSSRIPLVRKAAPGQNRIVFRILKKDVSYDGFEIDFPDARTMRISGTGTSIKSGIVHILEKYFGVRFLMRYPHWLKKRPAGYDKDLETVFPVKKDVAVPMKREEQNPSVNLMRLFSGNLYYDWKVRQHSFPGGHSMTKFAFPAKKYAPDNSWPKEILPIINGKKYVMPKFNPKEKNPYHKYVVFWQPCWSNPATAEIGLKNILEVFRKEPGDWYGKRYHVELSINDNGGCCECERCLKAVNGKRNSVGKLHYSELYWKWIKEIAEGMQKHLPGVYVVAYAYREVLDPPTFKLPDNVIVQICRELLIGAIDPAERKVIENTFRNWSKKVKTLFIYDYFENSPHPTGGYVFMLPRVHINSYAEMFRMAYKYGVRGVYMEGNHNIPMSGPTLYLLSRLYWNIHTDLDADLEDWCIAAVGRKAAPYLMEYYREWERYWLRPEILKTNFGQSTGATYLPLGEAGTYSYALTENDLKKFRSLMDKVLQYAGTPLEKKRAEFFRRLYIMTERATDCLYSTFIEPDGFVKDSAAAVKLIQSIPKGNASLEYLKKEPLFQSRCLTVVQTALCNLKAIVPFKNDPAVLKALKETAADKTLPLALRAQLEILAGSSKYKNLLENGSFEKGNIRSYKLRTSGALSREYVSDGKYAYKSVNGCVRFIQKKIIPNKSYLVMVDVYADKISSEGRFTMLTNPRVGEKNSRYNILRDLRIVKGWQTISNTFVAHDRIQTKSDNILIQISMNKFEPDESVWLDNIRLYQLD
ncbi:MAG: DUF4838 domain-containing protein [Lentisphaeria bacterium]|nr:DUF4838 domain-containing protein [Lentisphaeria bacterium]